MLKLMCYADVENINYMRLQNDDFFVVLRKRQTPCCIPDICGISLDLRNVSSSGSHNRALR